MSERDSKAASAASPLVTIITPSLNQGEFIEQALASVGGQSFGDVEHLVVDGGSVDGTLAILLDSEGVRWISEPDRGMYDALNKGLAMAGGEILGYLNCDDVLTPWAVETAVRAFDANPDADAVYGDGLTIDASTGKQRLALVPPFSAHALARSGSLVQPAVFWRRGALERVGGFDADLRFVGDLDYWLRLGRAGRFVRVDEVLAIERHHDASLSRAAADRMAAEAARVRNRHQPAGKGTPSGAFVARARAAAWRRILWVRFLRRVRGAQLVGEPWARFISEGELTVSPLRVTAMFVPRLGAPFAWDAVVSDRQWFAEEATSPMPGGTI